MKERENKVIENCTHQASYKTSFYVQFKSSETRHRIKKYYQYFLRMIFSLNEVGLEFRTFPQFSYMCILCRL